MSKNNLLIEQLKENSALEVTSTIEGLLRQKTKEAIEEARKQVAAEAFGMQFEDPMVNEAVHPIVKKHLANIDHDDLSHAERQMLQGRHPKNALSGIDKSDMTKAERNIADHFKISEAEKKTGKHLKRPEPAHQVAFNKRWGSADDTEKKKLKAHAWDHGYDIPDLHSSQSHAKSPISSFAEEDVNEELIPGHKLNDKQKKHVLSAFVHRHTGEHASSVSPKPTHKTDDDWVKAHAFHFNKKTGNLSGRHKYAEPHYMAKDHADGSEVREGEL